MIRLHVEGHHVQGLPDCGCGQWPPSPCPVHVEATCSVLALHGGVGVVDLASGIALLLELVNWKLHKQK